MSKFKVGDTVRCVIHDTYSNEYNPGDVTTVSSITSDDYTFTSIRGDILWSDRFELVEPTVEENKFKVGDTVQEINHPTYFYRVLGYYSHGHPKLIGLRSNTIISQQISSKDSEFELHSLGTPNNKDKLLEYVKEEIDLQEGTASLGTAFERPAAYKALEILKKVLDIGFGLDYTVETKYEVVYKEITKNV